MLDGFLNFQEVWTLEKVKNMTLEEYTNIKKDNPNRDDFTFWIESKLDNLGSIWGGAQLLNLVYIEEMMKVRKNLLAVDYIVKIMLGLLNMAIMKMKHLIISKKKSYK